MSWVHAPGFEHSSRERYFKSSTMSLSRARALCNISLDLSVAFILIPSLRLSHLSNKDTLPSRNSVKHLFTVALNFSPGNNWGFSFHSSHTKFDTFVLSTPMSTPTTHWSDKGTGFPKYRVTTLERGTGVYILSNRECEDPWKCVKANAPEQVWSLTISIKSNSSWNFL